MKQTLYRIFAPLLILAFALSACAPSTPAPPTPDVAAVATAAAATVEARFTQQALEQIATQAALTPTPQISTPNPDIATPTAALNYEYAPGCVYALFVNETVLDGTLFEPGATFVKTWRIKNAGSCKWDSRFGLTFISGEQMTEQSTFPLTTTVYPGQEVDLSVTLTAPAVNGTYRGEWRLALPVGSSGVGLADENLSVEIEVTNRPDREFAVTKVVYTAIVREPRKGCTDKGAAYTFYADVTANGPGDLVYEWNRSPDDGVFEGGKLHFEEAGTKQVSFRWSFQLAAVQNIDRWVALRTYYGSVYDVVWDRYIFYFTCDT